LVGVGKALKIILEGHLFSGEEAFELGLVHYLVEHQELEKKGEEILRKIFVIPQHALSSAKKAVYASQYLSFSQGLQVETEEFGKCFIHDYFRKLIKDQLKDGRLKTTLRLQ